MKVSRRKQRAVLEKVASSQPLSDYDKKILGTVKTERLAHEPPSDAEIASLAEEALNAFEIAGAAVEQTLLAKAKAGRALAAKRDSLPHGEWLPWQDTIIPQRYVQRADSGTIKDAPKAWRREVLRWIEIHNRFQRFPAEALERAHTVRQLLQLADFIPEGENPAGGPRTPPSPDALVAGVEKWWTAHSAELNGQAVLAWPARKRADLAERLRPYAELFALLAA